MKTPKLFGVYIPKAITRTLLIRMRDHIMYRNEVFTCNAFMQVQYANPFNMPHAEYEAKVKVWESLLDKFGISTGIGAFNWDNLYDINPQLNKAMHAAGLGMGSDQKHSIRRARRVFFLNLLISKLPIESVSP